MTGIEIAVGYMFAYMVRKAKRVGRRADQEVDRGLDAGMDRLHDLISAKLGNDPALERAAQEAEAGQDGLSERTGRRLTDSLEDAAERDPDFAQALTALVEQLQAARTTAAPGDVSASGEGVAVRGRVNIKAEGGSAAALKMGSVNIGASPSDPSRPSPDQS
ncbi:hypothetical protein [Streptomyces malaysiense]|uniref:Chromosome partitioning protein n=1 Tax=Streptomyces malaysiense TaxID=1428626 RepID=A0A1J4PWZ8_9ACTN|nr:hypothetical protein [Streptomyces malaysiense]OIK25461.1 hypothetical protein VT52_021560 [Streptomyces malaysiense]